MEELGITITLFKPKGLRSLLPLNLLVFQNAIQVLHKTQLNVSRNVIIFTSDKIKLLVNTLDLFFEITRKGFTPTMQTLNTEIKRCQDISLRIILLNLMNYLKNIRIRQPKILKFTNLTFSHHLASSISNKIGE